MRCAVVTVYKQDGSSSFDGGSRLRLASKIPNSSPGKLPFCGKFSTRSHSPDVTAPKKCKASTRTIPPNRNFWASVEILRIPAQHCIPRVIGRCLFEPNGGRQGGKDRGPSTSLSSLSYSKCRRALDQALKDRVRSVRRSEVSGNVEHVRVTSTPGEERSARLSTERSPGHSIHG